MDDKLNTEKSDLQLGKGNFAKVVQIVNKIQQQLQNEKDYNHLREYLWLSMNSEKRMRDQNESNYHCWYQLSTSYLLVFKLLVIVVQTDLRYFFSLQGMYVGRSISKYRALYTYKKIDLTQILEPRIPF
ncbi:GSCOCG00001995001-RA-CDS [Cotesia congregata]|nr:GSCOCG00001995001-RA-CDS [Cotesia congregata]